MRLVGIAAAWVAGLMAGLEWNAYLPALALLLLASVLLALLLWNRAGPVWPALLAAVMLLGVIRVEAFEDTPPRLAPERQVVVRGSVTDDPEQTGATVQFTLALESLDRGQGLKQTSGKVLVLARPNRELVRTRKAPFFHYGDRLELTGDLKEPSNLGEFDYRSYLANQGIHSTMAYPQVRLLDQGGGNPAQKLIFDLRRRLSRSIDEALPEPQAALAQALLLGKRSRLPQEVTEDFRSTGTSHLLAISGLHVGVLMAMTLGAAAWLVGRRRQLYLLLPLAAMWVYALLSGLAPPVERAAIMGSVYLLALALGRPRSMLLPLSLAAAIMAGWEPQMLKQVSFHLSLAAMAGIALLTSSPLWVRLNSSSQGSEAWWVTLKRGLTIALAVSVAATLATLPLIAFNFHQIPILGIPATILALPALPFLLATSTLASLAVLVHPVAGQILGWPAWVFLEYLIRLVDLVSRVPGSTFGVPRFSGALVWACYAILCLPLLFGWAGLRRSGAPRPAPEEHEPTVPTPGSRPGRGISMGMVSVGLIALAFLSAVLWYSVASSHDGRLHVYFLDVGQGDSILVVTPGGAQLLIDGGPSPLGAVRELGPRMPFGDRDLDMVVLTHTDEDHFRGLTEVVDRYAVNLVLGSGGSSPNPLYLEWEQALSESDIRRVAGYRGQTILLDDGARLEVLNPPPQLVRGTGSDPNNNGIVLRLVYGQVSFLLTADIEAEAELRLLRDAPPLGSTVLKVPHHGSKTSTTPRFLSTVSPAAVISSGADNPFGHPHSVVTNRLDTIPGRDRTYVTAERGDIEFITDGARLWVKTGL